MKRLLVQTQLSNYNTKGKFILECDSGWQMVMGRVRTMLDLVPDLHIDVMGPFVDLDGQVQVVTPPDEINPDLFKDSCRVRYIEHWVQPNALETRYDFDFEGISRALELQKHKTDESLRYDAVYLNDPMHLRNFKAMFMLKGGYRPRYYVHSHFIDDPQCPKFPTEASLWMGQCEAARKADFNFWQCESAMNVFFEQFANEYAQPIVEETLSKSMPWDDGYSSKEITLPVNYDNIRFNIATFLAKAAGKIVIFVPNRIGGKGRSSDYTNCGKFMFEMLPKLHKHRNGSSDIMILCGNPSQKIFNYELTEWCSKYGYVDLLEGHENGAFNRDEYRFLASHSQIAVGLYDQDSYGGTAARECLELGCVPFWIDNYEYKILAKMANWPYNATNFGDEFICVLSNLIETVKAGKHGAWIPKLQDAVRSRCSYEKTTPKALEIMGLLK